LYSYLAGTKKGDPTEVKALASIYSVDRDSSHFCYLGSVKSNIGHTESAAGVAGLIKTCLSIYYGKIPPNLHFETPNKAIDWENIIFRVPTGRPCEWPLWGSEFGRIASINSFGFGGTNAHVILSSYEHDSVPSVPDSADLEDKWIPVPITANNFTSLKQFSVKLESFLRSQDPHPSLLEDALQVFARHRSHLRYRSLFIVNSMTDFIEQISKYGGRIDSKHNERIVVGKTKADTKTQKILFIFSGQGSQWRGMAADLIPKLPLDSVFRKTLNEIERLLDLNSKETSTKFPEISYPPSMMEHFSSDRINETVFAQTAIFAVQVALFELLRSWGIIPSAVLGHSVGEVAASYAAGIFTLPQAVALIHRRACLQQLASKEGGMLFLGKLPSTAVVTDLLRSDAERFDRLSIAAYQSHVSLTVSGDRGQLEELVSVVKASHPNIFSRFLNVSGALHSPYMEGIKEAFISELGDLTPGPVNPDIVLYSTVFGKKVTRGEDLGVDYWWNNIRHSVYFEPSVTEALGGIFFCTVRVSRKARRRCSSVDFIFFAKFFLDGFDLVVEVSSHPALQQSILEIATHVAETKNIPVEGVSVIPTLVRSKNGAICIMQALGKLFCSGTAINWPAVVKDWTSKNSKSRHERNLRSDGRWICDGFPTYAWDHQVYWKESAESYNFRFGLNQVYPLWDFTFLGVD
jgi:acyl transferase domain-containing protein